jgi:hypothetical protein
MAKAISAPLPADRVLESTPQPLRNNIMAMGVNFNPGTERPEYRANREVFQLYLDLMELDANNIKGLVERHGGTVKKTSPNGGSTSEPAEPDDKFGQRQKMAVVFNLVPTIINMMVGYLLATEPTISTEDEDLKEFLGNANGMGQSFREWMRLKGIPMALAMGWVDVLVQNPLVDDGGFMTAQEAKAAKIRPVIFPIPPITRPNWSANANGVYNFLTFKDFGNENPNPLAPDVRPAEAFITLSAYYKPLCGDGEAGANGEATRRGCWIRSWKGDATPLPTDASTSARAAVWFHMADFTPVERCAVATLYYRESIDPAKRHWGVSKIAMIAVLTRAILNILSWTQEDVLANLALFAFPSRGGIAPRDENQNPIQPQMNPATVVWYDSEGTKIPLVLQGSVDHIRVKMEIVTALVQEILRLANLIGSQGAEKQVQSGIQATVERNELFQELAQMAGALDAFTLEVLALVKSWATGEDWDAERLQKDAKTRVDWFKGPYVMDPMADVVANGAKVVAMFAKVSPTMAKAAAKFVARSYLYANDPDLPKVLEEIDNTGANAMELLTASLATMGKPPAPPKETKPGAPAAAGA